MKIYKYEVLASDTFTIDMPKGARILAVQTQGDSKACIWSIVDETASPVPRRFALRGTGHDASGLEHASYVGTFQIAGGSLVFHLFDLGE